MRTGLIVSLLCLSACTWVKPEVGAENVALVKEAHVINCKKLGNVYSNTHHRLVGLNRSSTKVSDELVTLAKNEAYELGADTIVARAPAANGEQSFSAYKCEQPDPIQY